MAQEVLRTCDYELGKGGRSCGKRVPDDRPTMFGLRDIQYEADLCETHAAALVDCLSNFVKVATPVRQPNPVREVLRGRKGSFTTRDVRNWLREQGRDVAPSGRLPDQFIQEYVEAQTQSVK